MALERVANSPTPSSPSTPWATATAALNASETNVQPSTLAPFPSGGVLQFRILIDSELMLVTALPGGLNMTVTRGIEGTTAASHASGAGIFHILTAAGLGLNPRAMTTAGDMEYLGATGAPTRLAAPSNGDYVTRWTSGVPSWVVASVGGDVTQAGTNTFTGVNTFVNHPVTLDGVVASGPFSLVSAGGKNILTTDSLDNIGIGDPLLPSGGVLVYANAGLFFYTTADQSTFWNVTALGASFALPLTGGFSYPVNETLTPNYSTFWGADVTGTSDHPYFLWYAGLVANGAAVWRVNELGIMAYYNPGFATDYTPGEANFERVRLEWIGSVATFGVEVGGTGTNRALNLVGSSVQANGSAVATASSATAFTNKTGAISQWTNDSSYTTLAAVAGVGYLTSVTAHNLLSATHGDTLTDSVVRGDVLIGNSTPKWARLAIGTASKVLMSDGTDVAWSASALGTAAYTAATAYEVPLTFSTGLTRTVNTVTVNTSQNIATLSNLTSNGLVTTSGAAGTLGVTVPGTGVLTALAVNLGSAGAFVTFNGALGTPSSGTLTSATGLPIGTGVSGLASGIATWLATSSLTNLNSAITGDSIVGRATTDTLTNKRITKRVTTASDATSITPNSDSADVTYQLNTQAIGTLTINADAGTPTNGQSWVLKIKSTNVQTFAWNAIFIGGTVALPTVTSGASKIDYFSFIYDAVTPKWNFSGQAVNF